MAFELKVIGYEKDDHGFLKEIQWNHEELKKAISERMADYRNLVYTDDQIGEAEKDKAQLNKVKTALNEKVKEIKNTVNVPYTVFKDQVAEITAIIDEGIQNIDLQIKEYDQKGKEEKLRQINVMFSRLNFPEYVTLEKVYNSRWMNKTYTMKQIKEDLIAKWKEVQNSVLTIDALPAFKEEAMILYKKNLDLSGAIREAKRLDDLHKAAEAQRQQKAAEQPKVEEAKPVEGKVKEPVKEPEPASQEIQEEIPKVGEKAVFTVQITAYKSEYGILNQLFKAVMKRGIKIEVTNKEVL